MKRNKPKNKSDAVYSIELLELVRKHLLDGWSYGSFAGRYGITSHHWQVLTRENPELAYLRDKSVELINDNKRLVPILKGKIRL